MLKHGLTCCLILITLFSKSLEAKIIIENIIIGLCVFYSMDHGGESRITAGLHKCMYTHTVLCFRRTLISDIQTSSKTGGLKGS